MSLSESEDNLAQSRTEIANLKLTIEKMEREIQTLRSELKEARAREDPGCEVWEEMGDVSDVFRPREWTLELIELAIRVYCDYCWKNVLSESQKNELHQMDIHDLEAFYRDPTTTYGSEPALRLFRELMPWASGIINLMSHKRNLIEFPRPYIACRQDWAERYSNCEAPHLPNQSPPTKAAFERLIRFETSDVLAADVISSAEGLWPAETETASTNVHVHLSDMT